LFIAWVQTITAATAALVAGWTLGHGCSGLPEIDDRLTMSALRCSAPSARSSSAHSR
jgi:hypothetical protein